MTASDSNSQPNFGVDYVIVFRYTDLASQTAQESFQRLIKSLAQVGLKTEVRSSSQCSLLLFVKTASERKLASAASQSRTRDWLHGIRAEKPDKQTRLALTQSTLSVAERLRITLHLITASSSEGGAGITPGKDEWQDVESIFALHDTKSNKEWIKKWSTQSLLSQADLDDIRNRFGEKLAFYFAFTQYYFMYLFFPAAFGLSCWALLGHFSPVYAIVNSLGTIVFVEYWRWQENNLAIRWGVKGVSAIQERRRDFKHDKETRDPNTGETVRVFSATKRLSRQLLQIPFALIACLALGTIIATCFAIEIFLSEVYNGPFKGYLVFLPTILLTGLIPTTSTLLTSIATRLNEYENWDSTEGYEYAMTSKIFVLNFITSYLPIFLTAFVYVPFGKVIVPHLDIFNLTTRSSVVSDKMSKVLSPTDFHINPDRLRKQVIYFTVTAQIVNFATETIVPFVKRKAFTKYQDIKTDRASKQGGAIPDAGDNDSPEEAAFMQKVRAESALAVYDVADDLREMVVQFGYLALFSVVWPLTACSFLINNWIELRSDAVKICLEMQRPAPHRADGIGPWLESLSFLTWMGSISSAALVYLFRNDGIGPNGSPSDIQGWALLLSIFFSEHIYLLVHQAVRIALSKIESPESRQEHTTRFLVRKRYLEEALDADSGTGIDLPEDLSHVKITRASLEEDARQGTLKKSGPNDAFWGKQRNWEESMQYGTALIQKTAPRESKKAR